MPRRQLSLSSKTVHSQVDFWFLGGAEFYVDGAMYDPLTDYSAGTATRSIVVPQGTHTYKWKVSATNAGRPHFALDSVACTSP